MMFAILLFTIITMPFAPEVDDPRIPGEYQGVWKIIEAVDEDGTRSSAGDAGFSESNPIEILIVGNRVIHVNSDGSSVLARATVLETKSGLTLDLRTGVVHDKENSPTYWNLELKNDKLKIESAINRYDKDPRANRKAVPSFQAIRQRR